MATVAAYFIIHWLVLQFRASPVAPTACPCRRPTLLRDGAQGEDRHTSIWSWCLAMLATIVAKNILRTRAGRAFVAIRDNDLAAEVMGVNLFWLQTPGVLHRLRVRRSRRCPVGAVLLVSPTWSSSRSSIRSGCLGMLIVGGMGSTSGVIYGVIGDQAAAAARNQDRTFAGRGGEPPGRRRSEPHPAQPGDHPLLDLRSARHRTYLGAFPRTTIRLGHSDGPM